MSVDYLSFDDLMLVAERILGSQDVLLRDAGALAAAAGRPQASAFGKDAYPTIAGKAAALLHSIARNHPLVDGNKRLAWVAAVVFCELNGYDLVVGDQELIEQFVLSVAIGDDMGVDKVAEFIQDHLVELPSA